ncbi:MAG: hypothetical protein K0S28_1698 [Paucimonas sp.]|jgi:hypothetical protein|nr:hypothetical protein [Paucimonas sp.]
MDFQPYLEQVSEWPQEDRHILAQYDDESIVVYQAYRQSIAEYAVKHQQFGGEFSYNRMSWIKPNFLWMMYRCGWASKEGQERVLAITIRREFFDRVLKNAVASSFDPSQFANKEEWKNAVETSDVRLQWDPDHDPFGRPTERRAIQLGLRGKTLAEFGREAIVSIQDVTDFVRAEFTHVEGDCRELVLPRERVYHP